MKKAPPNAVLIRVQQEEKDMIRPYSGNRKRIFSALLALMMILSLCACGSAGEQTAADTAPSAASGSESQKPSYPTGLFMFAYIGDEAGTYVPESNEFLDFLNQPTTLQDMMWADNATIWCEIGADGIGTYVAGTHAPVVMDFNTGEPGMLLFGGVPRLDGSGEYVFEEALVPYFYNEATGGFRFEEEPGFWPVMEPCSQEKLDLVFAGKGGSVPLSEAEIGDFVCMGTYDTKPDNDTVEPLYWRVIDKDGDRRLLLCDQLIDSFSYNYNQNHEVLSDVTWENCSLRAFLNDPEAGFLTMFTAEEIARMEMTHLENKAANEELMAQWGAFEDQGEKTYSDLATQNRPDDPDTDDRVFLLSYQEVLRYFGEPSEDSGIPAEESDDVGYPFAVMKRNPAWVATVTDAVQGGYYDNGTRAGAWMTRTLCNSHSDEDMVVYISSTGQVFDYFTYVPLFIRPAVWVNPASEKAA